MVSSLASKKFLVQSGSIIRQEVSYALTSHKHNRITEGMLKTLD